MYQKKYYGHVVRQLFIAAAVIMLLTYPYFSALLPQSGISMIIGIVTLLVLAGLTKLDRYWIRTANIIVSLFSLIYFESHAIIFEKTALTQVFMTDQALTIIFLIAFYFAVKTYGNNSEGKLENSVPSFTPKARATDEIKQKDPISGI